MTPQPRVPLWLSPVFAVLGGLTLWCAFAPIAWGLLTIPGAALVISACWGASWARGVLMGLIAGLSFFLPLLAWMHVIGQDIQPGACKIR